MLDIPSPYCVNGIKTSIINHKIKNILVQCIVVEEIFDQSALPLIVDSNIEMQIRQTEIQKQIKMEKLKLDMEERMKEKTKRDE